MRIRLLTALAVAFLGVGLGACAESAEPTGVLDREAFIATWVELRTAALRTGDPIPVAERARVLGERGVTEEEMLGFAEAHGDDPRYMAEVWTEIENRMRPPPTDSTAASDSTPQP